MGLSGYYSTKIERFVGPISDGLLHGLKRPIVGDDWGEWGTGEYGRALNRLQISI